MSWTFIDHIKRMVDAVGVDHVAIGTDLAGVSPRAALFTDWAEWPSIPAALLDRGFARHEVAAIMGGNMRRLLERQRHANAKARAGFSTRSRRSPASSTPLRRRRGTTFTSRCW
jgi:hypothetical protein